MNKMPQVWSVVLNNDADALTDKVWADVQFSGNMIKADKKKARPCDGCQSPVTECRSCHHFSNR